jgi:putative pyruvate formate lyase activating enzyme
MVFRLIRPDATSAWKNDEIKKRFPKYRAIIDGDGIARYLLAKTIPVTFSANDSIGALNELLKDKSKEFRNLLNQDEDILKKRTLKDTSIIDLAELIAREFLNECNFCERKCGVNRNKGEKGYCFLTNRSYVSSAFLHMGEESVLVPSGTIFFQGCNFGCLFCQNYDISQSWKGRRELEEIAQEVDGKRLAALAERLADKGALNINYVGGDPIPNIHIILSSLKFQVSNICQLWNSNFYCSEESLNLIINFMDFWLPDFKYGNNNCAKKYSGIDKYYDVLTRNLKVIHDQGSGEIIIRHLIMPNHVECCSKPILDYIAKDLPNCVVNIMGQYRPEHHANTCPEINRRPSTEEMKAVRSYADSLNILWRPVS